MRDLKNYQIVKVGPSRYLVERDGGVYRLSYGQETLVKSGKTVEEARRLARNKFALQDSIERRQTRQEHSSARAQRDA